MRILHFYKTYYPNSFGGIEQAIYQLARGGVSRKVESTVLSLSRSGERQNGIIYNHQACYSKTLFEVASTPFSLKVLKDFKALAAEADIIHYHFPWPFMDLIHHLSGSAMKKKTVVSYHSDIVRQRMLLTLYRPLMLQFLNKVDAIVATSPNYLQSSETLQRYKSKVQVIPIGLSEEAYPKVDPERVVYWRSRLGGRFFLFIGALRYYKGLHVLLEAARKNSYPIAILGGDVDQLELLQQKVDNLPMKSVYFLGALDDQDKVALLQACYGVVLPSHLRSEAFGITLLEGAMYGKPLISCEIGTGTSYININGETGYTVTPGSVQELNDAMQRLWENEEQAQQMGKRARERFEAQFTLESMVDRHIDLYRRLV